MYLVYLMYLKYLKVRYIKSRILKASIVKKILLLKIPFIVIFNVHKEFLQGDPFDFLSIMEINLIQDM